MTMVKLRTTRSLQQQKSFRPALECPETYPYRTQPACSARDGHTKAESANKLCAC